MGETISRGYNRAAIDELTKEIANGYKGLTDFIIQRWPDLQNTFRMEWIGVDEIDYEKVLAERLNKCMKSGYDLAQIAISGIIDVANGWIKTQNNNLMESRTITNGLSILDAKEYVSRVKQADDIQVSDKTFANDESLGLKNDNSASKLQDTISKFVGGIQSKSTEIFSKIDLKSAFYGSTSTKLELYVRKFSASISTVATSYQDLNDLLTTMAGNVYDTAGTGAGDVFNENIGVIEEAAETITSETGWGTSSSQG